jgi:small GTP-binding protein
MSNSVKVIFIGDSGVGKTSLMNALLGNTINTAHLPTTGPEFRPLKLEVNGHQLFLEMWDTAGQESYRAITRMFFRNADIVILCYSVGSRDSFRNIEVWKEMMSDEADNAIIILVGAKKDLRNEKTDPSIQITLTEVSEKARQCKWQFIETSSKTLEGVEQLKELMARAALTVSEQSQAKQLKGRELGEAGAPTKTKCC